MAISEYSWLVTNLLTGAIIDEVELQSFGWKELYNRPGSASATARLDERSVTRTNFDAWRNGLWLRQGDQIIWGGYIGAVSPIAGTRALNVPIYGFMEYPRHRFIRSGLGMSNATTSGSAIKWTNKDIFLIAKDLIDHVQAFATGDIGINVIYDALSGVITSATYYAYEYKFAGVAFEQLSDNIAGFDWRYTFDWDGDIPRCNVLLSKIPQGRRTQFVLEYDHEPGKKNILQFDPQASDPPVNGVGAVGAGEGDTMLRSYVSDLGTGYPLFEGMISYKDVTLKSTLDNHAYKHLERNKQPLGIINANIDSRLEPHHGEFIVGDEMLVRVRDNWLDYSTYYRVFEKSMTLTKEHDLEISLGLEFVG